MSSFRKEREEATAAGRAPPLVVNLRPCHFTDAWKGKPADKLPAGVRILSEAELAEGRRYGVERAMKAHPTLDETSQIWADAYNQALMHFAIATALCKPDDVDAPLWEMQDLTVPNRLSEGGVARLWDAILELKIRDSPLSPEIDAAALQKLAAHMASPDAWRAMNQKDARSLRRLLARALDYLP